jgi:hypothetical protein
MNVKKIGKIRIPPSYQAYFDLQRYKKCPQCRKGKLSFTEDHRTFHVICTTPSCPNTMSIPIPVYYTFDELYEEKKKGYVASMNTILREKFDLLFDYKKSTTIEPIKQDFLKKRSEFQDIQQRHQERIESTEKAKAELLEQKAEMIQKIKQQAPIKQEELNTILNELHTLQYIKIGHETIPMPSFEKDILVY